MEIKENFQEFKAASAKENSIERTEDKTEEIAQKI